MLQEEADIMIQVSLTLQSVQIEYSDKAITKTVSLEKQLLMKKTKSISHKLLGGAREAYWDLHVEP